MTQKSVYLAICGGVLWVLLWFGQTETALAEHECHFDQNQQLVCPEHEEEQEQQTDLNQPENDRDQDGVPDDQDDCPDEAGLPEGPNGPGCPESSDTAGEGEDLDLDLPDNQFPDIRFECIGRLQDTEVCLFQAFLLSVDTLEFVRVVDRCSQSEGELHCERRSERHQCDEFGLNCQRLDLVEIEETCGPNGDCEQRVLISNPGCMTVLGICVAEAAGLPDALPGGAISEHGLVFEGAEDCNEDMTRCSRDTYRCERGECRRIGQKVTESGCFTDEDGNERCTTTTATLRCDAEGICVVIRTVREFRDCNADGSICRVSVDVLDCDPPAQEDDLDCSETDVQTRELVIETMEPDRDRTQRVTCDPERERCDIEIEEHREEKSGGETTTVWEESRGNCDPDGFLPGAAPDCVTDYSKIERCPESAPCVINTQTVLERDADGNPTRSEGGSFSDCEPGMELPDDRCNHGERFTEECDGSGCTRTITRGYDTSGDTGRSWTGEVVCPGSFSTYNFDDSDCRTVSRRETYGRGNEDGSQLRGIINTECDPDTRRCQQETREATCEPDLSRCEGRKTNERNVCDRHGACPSGGDIREDEEWTKTCEPDGSCIRTGTRTSSECVPSGPDSCTRMTEFTSMFVEIQNCDSGEAFHDELSDDTNACTLAESRETIRFSDGREVERTTTCDADSCTTTGTITNPDGSEAPIHEECTAAGPDDTAPYDICIPVPDE